MTKMQALMLKLMRQVLTTTAVTLKSRLTLVISWLKKQLARELR